MTNIDLKLMARFLKFLATDGLITETGVDHYDTLTLGYFNLGEFLDSTNWKNPTDKDVSAFKLDFKTDLHYFDWITRPENKFQLEAFHNHMKFKTLGEKWYQTVPLEEILRKGTDQNEVLLVDVGGGSGHDLIGFHKHNPGIPGRLILQDLPETIQTLNVDEMKPIEPMGHNFFTPQSVQYAKAYYLKMVLHDWPDSQGVEILKNLKPAMKPGYSKILINEIVIPETDADWFSTSVDILMMVVHSSAERREKEWRALIESAGLSVVKIWTCGSASEKLVEVELP
ncbi:hypothetical protein H072_6706 [Dactylellina haptotyla CBS 200.50]|uniref:O-methyltransferase C-terminal domain-containing protein n=1 Tax=Dactylellina haptotyla (strain CBS 200.50) TaxID=1284197 RepID=S8A9P5_DACHA|nr:hypothetical protein H072_6706 [Dactylellina haptotyla CBS 200.50]